MGMKKVQINLNYNTIMNKNLVFVACIMLAACGTKESNSTQNDNDYTSARVETPAKPEMTPEEETVARNFEAVKAKDMGNGYFKVGKSIASEELDSLVYEALEKYANCKEKTSLVWGVVDAEGNWIVPAKYQSVERSLGYGAFVVSYTEWVKDWSGDYDYYGEGGQIEHPWRYQQLFAVYYNGKIVAGWDTSDKFETVTYSDKVCGFMHSGNGFYDWYPLGNDDTFNHYLYVIAWTTPMYNKYEVKDGKLYMWNTNIGETFAEAKANSEVPEEEKSVKIWDLRKGKCIYDPFVPTD